MDSFMKTNKQQIHEKKDIIITHGVYSLNIAPCIGIPFIHTPTYKHIDSTNTRSYRCMVH